MGQIVLVEDDLDIRTLVAETLAAQGHHVESAATGLEGIDLAMRSKPDLVILDLGLPDVDGSDVLRMMRSVSNVPVVVITARGAEQSMIETLDAGADDYLVKPFSVGQLEARVRAVLRRASDEVDTRIRVGDLEVDAAARTAKLDGVEINLSPKEFDLLRALAEREGQVVTKRELLAEVWREPYGGSEKTVDVHLSWLRRKLGETASEPRLLHTVHGVGVKLSAPEP